MMGSFHVFLCKTFIFIDFSRLVIVSSFHFLFTKFSIKKHKFPTLLFQLKSSYLRFNGWKLNRQLGGSYRQLNEIISKITKIRYRPTYGSIVQAERHEL